MGERFEQKWAESLTLGFALTLTLSPTLTLTRTPNP